MKILELVMQPYWPVIWKMLLCFGVTLAAIGLDLYAGIRKAREAGITVIHTYGLDRTLDKIRKRFNLLLSFTIIDIVLIACGIQTAPIPYATALVTVVFCVVEARSIFEKDRDKGRYVEAARTAAEMWKGFNKEEFAEIIFNKLNKTNETDTETDCPES